MKHNGIISFWKFVFCIVIVIFHAGELFQYESGMLLRKGSIAVEFFFLVSGYLMAKTAVSKTSKLSLGKETFMFILKKIKSFFPYVFIAFMIDIILRTYLDTMNLESYVLSIFDLFLLIMPGFKTGKLIRHVWYISAMLICMSFLYPQIKKFKDNYFYLIAPLSVILIAGWLNHNYSDLREPFLWIGFTYKGVVRAYFELCLGSLLYPISLALSNIKFTKFGRVLLTIIELSGYLITILISHFIISSKVDFILVVLLSISILLSFSNKVLESSFFNKKIFYFLEKISLPIYLVHIPIRNFLISPKFNLGYYQLLLILIISSVIAGYLIILIVEFFKDKKFFVPKIKKLLIE